ncbi:MAG: GGDEF domain-containing protein [Candidatus Omnitrophota bacterium]|nr:GGDEF domain-containing protein [Candidatus Omnitrophota bacterium]
MLNSVVLLLFTVILFVSLKKKLHRSIVTWPNYTRIKDEYHNLFAENKKLKIANHNLENTLGSIIALYDITEQICKSLDIDKIFSNFRDEINKYIRVSDCEFIKGKADLSRYKDCAIIPLNIEEELIGYLVADGLAEEDHERFHILSQQFLLGIKRAVLYKGVQELAIIDSLTSISNRRHFLERFEEELERSKKFDYKFSCLMIDIDYFKDFNDRYGHIVGDAILRELSRTIQENIRQIDLIGRYGGEEFSIILSETDKDGAQFAAERIRLAIQDKHIRAYDEELKITVSIGISIFPYDGKDMERLIDTADAALYQAKQAGKNRVCLYK